MLTLGASASATDEPEVVQLSEDSRTLELLLSSMSDDLQELPDLLKLSEDGLIRLYEAAFKYDMVHLQVLSEHIIRCRLSVETDKIQQEAQLAALIRHATVFNDSELLNDTAAAIARRTSQPDDPFFLEIIQSMNPQDVKILLRDYSELQRVKEMKLEESLEDWIDLFSNLTSSAPAKQAVADMSKTLHDMKPHSLAKRKHRAYIGARRLRGQESMCTCCELHESAHSGWGKSGGNGSGWGNSSSGAWGAGQ